MVEGIRMVLALDWEVAPALLKVAAVQPMRVVELVVLVVVGRSMVVLGSVPDPACHLALPRSLMGHITDLVGQLGLGVMVEAVAAGKVRAMWTLVVMVVVVAQELAQVMLVPATHTQQRHRMQMQMLLAMVEAQAVVAMVGVVVVMVTGLGTVEDSLKLSWNFKLLRL